MFVRKGQALGSVNYQRLAELRAETPTEEPEPEPVAEVVEPETPEPETVELEERPKDYAPKPDWVAWAVHEGADPTEAESLTKVELIELYGGES